MQNTNAYVASEEREEIPNEGKAAQQLEQILTSGLPPLYRRAYRILGNAADAEDAVQDALLAAYTHLHQFRGQAQISTWLTTIVLNCARLQLRRRAKHVQVSLDESTGGPQPVSVSERLADHRPNPEDEYRKSELSTRLTHLHSQLSPESGLGWTVEWSIDVQHRFGHPTGSIVQVVSGCPREEPDAIRLFPWRLSGFLEDEFHAELNLA